MKRWFYSDPHFYHANILKFCPDRKYSSIEEMNEAFVRNWNDLVRPDDEVYCLGDFSMAIRPVEIFTPRLMGRKFLIAGNHDWCHPANKKSRKEGSIEQLMERYKSFGWETVDLEKVIELKNGQTVRLNHMPYLDDKDVRQNHKKHRPIDDGLPLICGHVHQHWKLRWSTKGTPMLNVGVDVWDFKPVGEDVVIEMLNQDRVENQSVNEVDRDEDL